MRAWLGKLLCFLEVHEWRVVRVLKPYLYIEFGKYLGCDLECARCGRMSWWREVERDYWCSPYAGVGYDHPNRLCPCAWCRRVMEGA